MEIGGRKRETGSEAIGNRKVIVEHGNGKSSVYTVNSPIKDSSRLGASS